MAVAAAEFGQIDPEDWLSLEIGRKELDGPEFFEVYYSEASEDEPYRQTANSRAGLLEILETLKKMLVAAYSNCDPSWNRPIASTWLPFLLAR